MVGPPQQLPEQLLEQLLEQPGHSGQLEQQLELELLELVELVLDLLGLDAYGTIVCHAFL